MAKAKTEVTVKLLNPKAADTKYLGDEPTWHLQPEENRNVELHYAFKWYGYYYGKKEAREFVAQWLDRHNHKADAKRYRAAPDSAIETLTLGWVARMEHVGLHLLEEETAAIIAHVESVIASQVAPVAEEKEPSNKPNIQDRLRERAAECGGEIEGLFDELITSGFKLNADYKPASILRSMNIQPQQINIIADPWRRRVQELNDALAGKDEQLVEGYSHLSKAQLKTAIKFCELVVNDCAAYTQQKKAERAPRVRKAQPPAKVAAKFKFQREFAELNLKSVQPAELVNASEAWLYDSSKRKLIHVVADQHVGTFTVKGTSIIGFDAAKTVQKTLRKPAEQIKSITTVGKPAARKAFEDIKSTEAKWSGRSNDNIVILKAF